MSGCPRQQEILTQEKGRLGRIALERAPGSGPEEWPCPQSALSSPVRNGRKTGVMPALTR
jgi:hypothetical protein